jgi:hypothetical protein
MSTSVKWVLGILVGTIVLALGAAALGIISIIPVRVVSDGPGEPVPTEVAAIDDGEWFAFVTVGTDEAGAVVLGVDLAEMLTGEPARVAAVEAGFIGEGEDLPNDFFIDNPEATYELLAPVADAPISVIPADDTSGLVEVGVEGLAALSDGTWDGAAVYGIVPGTPIAMEVTVEDGRVASAEAVYLP